MAYYNRDQRGQEDRDAAAGWAIGLLFVGAVVVGLAVAAFVAKCTPVAARGMVKLTRLLLPQLAALLHHTIRWPSSGRISSQATASALGLILWGSVSLMLGFTLFLLGSSPVVILITTALGATVGAAAGAASVSQPNNLGNPEDLDSYLHF